MIPGPANILSCPFCGGTKEVMSLISGNTYGATVWSDTRRDYPMLPEVSPIQKCPHCQRFYFIEQAKQNHSDGLDARFSDELGKLSLSELIEAEKQMEALSLTKMQRWILNHQIFMAFNDCFRREPGKAECQPDDEQTRLYHTTIDELLEGMDQSENFDLFHAELLRELGRFEEAREVLLRHKAEDDKWVVEAMLRHIDKGDAEPFLLMKNGVPV